MRNTKPVILADVACKNFAGAPQTTKFMEVFSVEISRYTLTVCLDKVLGWIPLEKFVKILELYLVIVLSSVFFFNLMFS